MITQPQPDTKVPVGNIAKVYIALLSQSGTSAPTANVKINTIGNIVWTRISAGRYLATLTGAFPGGKTLDFFGSGVGNNVHISSDKTGAPDTYYLETDDIGTGPADNQIDEMSLAIYVYNN